jgi:glycosyltransferase involved in cell wall biosynthesis
MLVRHKFSADPAVREVRPHTPWMSRRRRVREGVRPPRPLPEATTTFNFDVQEAFDERSLFEDERPDVIVVHRITRFLTVRQLARLQRHHRRPLIWLLHDQFPVTGGCHFSLGCERYEQSCGCCPQLQSSDPHDATRALWLRKQRELASLPIVFVGQSREAVRWVARSSLFAGRRKEVIAQPIDVEVFKPVATRGARELLGVPLAARVVMLGAGDLNAPRKGIRYAVDALRSLHEDCRRGLLVLAVGKGGGTLAHATGLPTRWLGELHDDVALAVAYAAADVFVSPSLADAGPLMIAEALLCGRPVVAFSVGLAADVIANDAVGRLAPPADSRALADGIAAVLRGPSEGAEEIRRAAALGCSPDRVAAAYGRLFRSLSL